VGEALGSVLPLAVAVAIFPVPIIASVLVLGSDRGIAKGVAFALAWSVGLAAVGAVGLVVAAYADASEEGEPATWVNALLLALGLLLVGVAVRQWQRRPRSNDETPIPGWMSRIDDFTVARAGQVGFALTALNPKNILLVAAAATEIAEHGLPVGEQAITLLAFVLLASAGVLTPLLLTLALGDRSRGVLDGLRGWLARHNTAIMAALFAVIGAKLIGDAIAGFAN
jgi:threonine/homoserine/homoserine lactone efflux protein